jgi:hypothetical protein
MEPISFTGYFVTRHDRSMLRVAMCRAFAPREAALRRQRGGGSSGSLAVRQRSRARVRALVPDEFEPLADLLFEPLPRLANAVGYPLRVAGGLVGVEPAVLEAGAQPVGEVSEVEAELLPGAAVLGKA